MSKPKYISILIALLLAFVWLAAAVAAPDTAQDVLARLHSAFPAGPLRMQAQMQTKTPSGKIESTYLVEILYASPNETLSAEIKLSDAFGTPLEKITAKGIGSGTPEYRYYEGENLESAQMPDLHTQIRDTDFRWQDLTLSFLWWPNGSIAGMDSLKRRECYVIDMPAPESFADAIQGARLWIDAQMYVLLRAKFYDSDNELIKRFDVKSFAKTRDLWMVKDIDIRTYPSRHRTVLRVRDVEKIEGDASLD